MSAERVTATYLIETPHSLEHAAEVLAGEQSSGTFVAVPGETVELKAKHGARVERIDELEPAAQPSLPGSKAPKAAGASPVPPVYRRGRVVVSFPLHNFGPSLPSLLSTVAGNLYELQELSGVRLEDLDLPDAFARRYPGPAFGVDGTRRAAGVEGRALVGTIIKPSIGLSIEALRPLVRDLALAGIDFIKDDELNVDPDYAPFEARLAAVMPVLHRHAQRLGRMPMYAINISGGIDQMRRRHDAVLRAGGSCVMVSVNAVGMAGVEHLRSYSELPIHAHRNGWGALTRHPLLGLDFMAYQKLWRLAGVDHLHVNGLRGKFWEPDDSVIASARACLAPFSGMQPIVPVFSSGQWGGQAPDMYAALRSMDLMHLAGGGIVAHPQGPAAGVTAMRDAWQAAVEGASLESHSRTRPALRAAIDKFAEVAPPRSSYAAPPQGGAAGGPAEPDPRRPLGKIVARGAGEQST